MSLFAQGTYHRATEDLRDGDWFHNNRDLACRDMVYLSACCDADDWNYDSIGTNNCLWGWGPTDADAHLIRYMNGFARKIQRCFFNREEQPMACPCPE